MIDRVATDLVFVELALSTSAPTLEQTRDAAIAAGQRAGFRTPVIEGNRFFFTTPIRKYGTQKDLVGWIVPGTEVVVVNRNAHTPVATSTRQLLNRLAPH